MKTKNKKIWTFLVSLLFVFSVFGLVSAQVTCPDTTGWDNSSGVCIPTQTGLPNPTGEDPLVTVAMNVMDWILSIVGVIAIIAFAISGIQYLLSAGNEDIIETAKRNMKWSIIGVIVALSGLIIINFVNDTILNETSSGTGGGSGNGSGSGTWINPDTGQPYDYDTGSGAGSGNGSGSGTWINPDTGQTHDYSNPVGV